MPLFTVVMDYRGGTFVSQVSARSVEAALRRWAAGPGLRSVPGIGPARAAALAFHPAFPDPVPVTGVSGVWCDSPLIMGRVALLTVVATVPRTGSVLPVARQSTRPRTKP